MKPPPEHRQLLTATEVAAMFRVTLDRPRKWYKKGLLTQCVKTPGGRLRYDAGEIAEPLARREFTQVHTYGGNGERE